ncbi:MAG: PA2779 family protein [Burkholderiales bacterium]
MRSRSFALICRALMLSLLLSSFQSARAGMIGTDHVTAVGSAQLERTHISGLLARDDVSRQLQALGVDLKTVQERVAMLTDEEARSLAGNLQSVPAGADAGGVIVVLLIAGALAWWFWGRR